MDAIKSEICVKSITLHHFVLAFLYLPSPSFANALVVFPTPLAMLIHGREAMSPIARGDPGRLVESEAS